MDDGSQGLVKYQNGLGIDDKLKLTVNGQANYFSQDHLGSTIRLTDQNGGIKLTLSYDSFGTGEGLLQTETRYLYTGREYDGFTGLYYYRARWYDAQLGRFISEDPIGLGGGINQFGYVGNNPVSSTDSLGLFPDGPTNSLRNLFSSDNWIGNGLSNTVSDLLALDSVAQWGYTIGDYRCSTSDRVGAGAKLAGLTAFQAFGGYAAGKIISKIPLQKALAFLRRSPAVNQTITAILKDGFYEVNGFKFSDFYYNKLWNTGRGAPSLAAGEILQGATNVTPDAIKAGFFRYEFGGWEMVYNPITKEVWHIQPMR